MKILFVCLGNICRSPLADGLLRKKVLENNLDVEVESAGTANFHVGANPDPRMIETALSRKTDISQLKGRHFKASDLDYFDFVYVMDISNLDNVMALATNSAQRDKIKLVLNESFPGEDLEVPDPYYGRQTGFEHVYDLLDQATDKIIEKIKNS